MPRKKQKVFAQYEEAEVKKEPSSSSSPSSDLEAESQAGRSVLHSEMRTIDGQILRLKADISNLQTELARLNAQSLAVTLSQGQQHVDRAQQQLRGQDLRGRESAVAVRYGGGEAGGAVAAAGRSRVIAKAKCGILTNRWFKRPRSFAFDDEGNLVVSDHCNHRIQVLRYRDGLHVRTIGSIGTGNGKFMFPFSSGIAFDRSGHLVVADYLNHRVQVLRYRDGAHVCTIGSQGSGAGQLDRPWCVAIDGDGRIVVGDLGSNLVQVLP